MTIDLLLFRLLNDLAGVSRLFDYLVIFFANYLQYFLIGVFLILLAASSYSRRKKIRILFIVFVSSLIARFGITTIIRFFWHRPRPFLIYPTHRLFTDNAYSFPSGHASFFFAFAAAIYFYNKRWGAWFFLAGALMAVSRVIAGVHYPSDILGGMLIGIAVAYAVRRFAPKKNGQENAASES